MALSALDMVSTDFHLRLAAWSLGRLLRLLDGAEADGEDVRWEWRELAARALRSRFELALGLDQGLEVEPAVRAAAAVAALDALCSLLPLAGVLHVPAGLLRAACVQRLLDGCGGDGVFL